jgi:RNA polymerase sigma-70 factor (ECF subfamily)
MPQTARDSQEIEALLAQAQKGNRQAFDLLFAMYEHYLHKVIGLRMDRRLRSRLDPADVLQETRLEAFHRLPDYYTRRPMSFRLWLRSTACQRLLMLRRHHLETGKRAALQEVRLPDRSSCKQFRSLRAPGSTPSQHVMRGELTHRIKAALLRLPDADQEILHLRNAESLSNQEAAEILQLDPATASQRYGRALLRLRKELIALGLSGSAL